MTLTLYSSSFLTGSMLIKGFKIVCLMYVLFSHHLISFLNLISDTLDSSMPSISSMPMNSPPDIKPDISSLTPTSSHGHYFGFGHSIQPQMSSSVPSTMPSLPTTLHSNMSSMGTNHISSQGHLHSPPLQSPPSSSLGSPPMMSLSPGSASSPPHLSSSFPSKHICAICGDRASGKHYGVYR